MARIQNGILGGGRGKVSNVIMGIWKGIDYIKAYAVPANPQTPAQQANRTPWGELSKIMSAFNVVLIQEYFRSAKPRMSGYNAFMQVAISLYIASATKALADFLRNPSAEDFLGAVLNDASIDPSSVVVECAGGFQVGDRVVVQAWNQEGTTRYVPVTQGEATVTVAGTTATVLLNGSAISDEEDLIMFAIRGTQISPLTIKKRNP